MTNAVDKESSEDEVRLTVTFFAILFSFVFIIVIYGLLNVVLYSLIELDEFVVEAILQYMQ